MSQFSFDPLNAINTLASRAGAQLQSAITGVPVPGSPEEQQQRLQQAAGRVQLARLDEAALTPAQRLKTQIAAQQEIQQALDRRRANEQRSTLDFLGGPGYKGGLVDLYGQKAGINADNQLKVAGGINNFAIQRDAANAQNQGNLYTTQATADTIRNNNQTDNYIRAIGASAPIQQQLLGMTFGHEAAAQQRAIEQSDRMNQGLIDLVKGDQARLDRMAEERSRARPLSLLLNLLGAGAALLA